MPEKTVPGTTITETSMAKMLRHNREITGQAGNGNTNDRPVDHNRVAEGLRASQPILLPGVGAPRIRSARPVLREGVQGTSPSPGQDNDLGFIPPTTSNTADPGNIPAKGPDAENQPATKGVSKAEQFMRDLGTLFGEADNPFAKGDEDDNDDKDDGDNKDDKDDDNKDDKDDKDGKNGTEDGDEEPVEEAVQVNCENCGYEEVYDLSESNIAEGNVPMTPDGKLDDKCPMCGADMDLSMLGATNVGEIGDPNPRTDARGNSLQRESVAPEAIAHASNLMQRVVAGESIELMTKSVLEGEFIPRKKKVA